MTSDPILAPPHGGEGWRGEIAATLALAWPLVVANLAQMLVYAVDEAVRSQKPRTLAYVAKLGGGAHADVLHWAAAQPNATFAQAARDELAGKP